MDEFDNMLINLKVLQSLQCHVRLDTTETLFKIHIAGPWVPTWIRRWWAHQTRLTDITRIQTLYQDARHLIDEHHPQSGRILSYLSNSRKGLSNLKTTYCNDPTVVALLDVILDSVEQLDSTALTIIES
jgi:hypothetical protein